MSPKKEARKIQASTIIENLKIRGMEGYYFDTSADCVSYILSQMPQGSSISWGGSMTFEETGMKDALTDQDYVLIDRMSAKTPEERRSIYAQTVMSDFYFMSTNAITLDGELINIDGNGNRLACLLQGPQNIMILTGLNKITSDIESGIRRVKDIASPANTVRLNKNTPCSQTGRCNNCFSPDCICSHTVITRRSGTPGRIKIFLINEDLGY
ncbi:lactate utilization protein [bacterium C-53]|nr:lactate utilization protein [Lachnospiraceae bacterium]NBI03667.1 lactate utilization protein [Lachnospiraceae bacterium]RKJ09227.1 lactate utilization protein [bacterium C-53]